MGHRIQNQMAYRKGIYFLYIVVTVNIEHVNFLDRNLDFFQELQLFLGLWHMRNLLKS